MTRLFSRMHVLVALTVVFFVIATTVATRAGGTYPIVSVVMSGLDNPRGLAFGNEGALYVAEAGRGGSGPCIVLRGANRCYGATGALTRLWRGVQERVVTGLPSYVDPLGEAIGPHDVSVQGRSGADIVIGVQGDPAVLTGFGAAGALFGTLLHASGGGQLDVVANIGAYESLTNPDSGAIDSNPFAILAEPRESRSAHGPEARARIVVDAGANALLRVSANGDISTIATFPSRSQGRATDAVPTSVVVGPDGAYYVSELTGTPFADGAARIYRVVPGADPEVFLDGFKTIIDLDFAPDGSLYVLQHSSGATAPTPPFFTTPGQVIRVARNGTRTVVYDHLTRPTSLVIGLDGAIYVSNFGQSVGVGEVLRIVEDPIVKTSVSQVPGGVVLSGSDDVPCDLGNEGALRYSYSVKSVVFCNGSQWRELQSEPLTKKQRR